MRVMKYKPGEGQRSLFWDLAITSTDSTAALHMESVNMQAKFAASLGGDANSSNVYEYALQYCPLVGIKMGFSTER